MEKFFSENRNYLIRDLKHDISVGYDKVEEPKSMLKCHYHADYELYYLYAGERFYFIKDTTYHIKKGTLVLIPPNIVHATLNVKNYAYERFLATFTQEHIKEFSRCFEDINFFEPVEKGIYVVSFAPREQLVIESIFQNMLETDDSTKKRFLLTQILFYANNNKEIKPETGKNRLSGKQKTITDVIAYINNNFSHELTLETVSSEFFMDSCYLSRIFKKAVGISFVDYINSVRVMEAKKLLGSSDESIIYVSESVGFKSNTHFGRVFKKITGLSPIQYRKSVKTGH